jgi:Mn2+/Fe2+ NRAMP family transporter
MSEPTKAAFVAPTSFWKLAGPGLIVAASGIGSGDVVSATVGGANYGVVLLWAVAIGAFFKFVLNEGIARWQLATGTTVLEGWAEHLPRWVIGYFWIYLVVWTIAVSAALTNAAGLGITNLTGGAIAQSWGAVLHSLAGGIFVALGGYANFEKLVKGLVGVMGFSILVCAVLTFDQTAAVLRGLLVPTIPAGGGAQVLSLIGGIGGSISMLSYNYWMREEGLRGAPVLRYVRGDVAIAYLFTALFGMSIMLLANQTFYLAGLGVTDAQAVPRMAQRMGDVLGVFGVYAFSVGFWAAVFASLLGVWQSTPYLFADVYAIFRKLPEEERRAATQTVSPPYRWALLFMTLVPLPFAFLGRPILIVMTFTIIGSLFIPFLAVTLLYLNNRIAWPPGVPHNHWTTNGLLIVILGLFLMIGALEVTNAVR